MTYADELWMDQFFQAIPHFLVRKLLREYRSTQQLLRAFVNVSKRAAGDPRVQPDDRGLLFGQFVYAFLAASMIASTNSYTPLTSLSSS